FKYMYDLLQARNSSHIRIYGGGGGVIVPREINELHNYGIARIFSPEDGRKMGLQGMINHILRECDSPASTPLELERLLEGDLQAIARFITAAERRIVRKDYHEIFQKLKKEASDKKVPVLGITGTGGAGKSSLTDELVQRFLHEIPEKKVAILSVDPSKRKTGGALLGDRIRMNAIFSPRIYMRSLATRGSKSELSLATKEAIEVVKAAGVNLVIVETSGIGQGDADIKEISDVSMYVMTSEFGAPSQLEKIDMIDYADFIVINKYERKGSEDAKRQVSKQYQRSHLLFDHSIEAMPVYGTIASQFNDKGTNILFTDVMKKLGWEVNITSDTSKLGVIIPNNRQAYLQEIVNTIREYQQQTEHQVGLARKLYQMEGAIRTVREAGQDTLLTELSKIKDE